MRGGKTPWEGTNADSSGCGVTMKDFGCTAHIRADLDHEYAKFLSSDPSPDTANFPKPFPTNVTVTIHSEHIGHDPEEDRDVNLLRMDARVRAKIQELASKPSLSVNHIKAEVHAFSDGLVKHLDHITTDSSQFYPHDDSIKKIVTHFWEKMRLDPQDHIAVQLYIDQDRAENTGKLFSI